MIIKDNEINKVIELLEEMHPEAGCALDHGSVFQLVVAVSLSAQTTDVSVNKVTPELFRKYPGPTELAAASQEDVEEIIRTIGLYKNKARNIIAMARMLLDDYNGEVPSTREELMSLPGVGRKTANVVLAEGFGEQAIAVDTHVFRVANRIGLCDEKDVSLTEKTLMRRIPHEKWIRVHHLLIFHGRKCCYARKPECDRCLLSKLCIYNTQKSV